MLAMICQLRQRISAQKAGPSARTLAVNLQNDLWQACRAIRRRDLTLAEELLDGWPKLARPNATYWNLRGLLAEAQGDWNKARRFWQRALGTNRRHQAAERNLRRYFEFYEWGWSELTAAFGDELEYEILLCKETR